MEIEDKGMLIAGGVIAGILETLIICWIWKKYNLWEMNWKNRKQMAVMSGAAALSVVFNVLLFQKQELVIECVNYMALYTIIAAVAGIDFKTKTIPNKILLVGIIIRLLLMAMEAIFYREGVKQTLVDSGIGFAFGLIFMLFLSFISKHGIGYGDVKLFAWIGLCVGFLNTYNILFYSVLVAAVVGVYLLLIKNKDKKTQLPFAPFVFVGTYMMLCFLLL